MYKKPNSIEEAHDMIKEAMENVMQEVVIIDESGEHHLIYVHSIKADNRGKVDIEYSTHSNREHVYPYLVKAITAQLEEINEELQKNSFWYKLKRLFSRNER